MYVVVMAGGSGTRFWPASRRQRPKQLLTLTGQRSLLQQTVERLKPLAGPERVLVVTGLGHAQGVREQLPAVPSGQILAEPLARNTAAAAGLAAAWVAKRDPGAVCLVLPADHLITDESLFMATLERAIAVARAEDVLVTLGLTPRYPATGFGYIETGQVLDQNPPQVRRVAAFHEKPALATAQEYLESGRHLWNSGMFAWRAEVLLSEISRHLPELAAGLNELAPHLGTPGQDAALAEIYPRLPSISVDHGVLEKSPNLRVVKADFGWSDLGSWEAVAELWPADQADNVCQDGRLLAIEAQGNVVAAGGRLIALLGVKDLVAVVTDDVLLILPKQRCQDVRQVIENLKEHGLDQYL
ncbi:MAG: mannose-1-phosphate guanylyltransferase [Desulfarculus sp.]|nr:mannose-1-phosphate guanylyltransferase [Desulfarculus sp.]